MKTIISNFLLFILSLSVFFLSSCNKDDDNNSGSEPPAEMKADIMVISDPHYFDPSLLISDGTAFQTYLAQDRKLLKESKAITEAVIEEIKSQKPDLLLIPGDMTKDGEKVSHENLVAMLDDLRNEGITVLVINGNHDVNNPHAMQYDGDNQSQVPSVTPQEFETIYQDYGYSQAIARDPNSLSYVAEPISGLRILALDVCHYNPHETGGSISAATLAWAVDQLQEAITAGKTIFGMMHHGLLEHYTGQKQFFSEYVIEDWQTVSETLLENGLQVMFTGHYHANDIVEREINGEKIYDIETGSTVTWPCPYRMITLEGKEIAISSGTIEQIPEPVPGGLDFQVYAKDFLVTGITGIAAYMLMSDPYNVPEDVALQIAPAFCNGFVAHYAGDEMPTAQDQADLGMVNGISPVLGAALGSLWLDLAPADNTYTITLK